jgi:hypothetical protein
MGGRIQRGSLTHDTAIPLKPIAQSKPSYLEPNSGSMQKPIEGLSPRSFPCLNKEERADTRKHTPHSTATHKTQFTKARLEKFKAHNPQCNTQFIGEFCWAKTTHPSSATATTQTKSASSSQLAEKPHDSYHSQRKQAKPASASSTDH